MRSSRLPTEFITDFLFSTDSPAENQKKIKIKRVYLFHWCVRLPLYLLDMEGDKKMQTKNDGRLFSAHDPDPFPTEKLTTDDAMLLL
jgi:hypothetical protein